MKIAVLGAGMVGRTIAIDLAKEFNVTSFDISNKNLSIISAKAAISGREVLVKEFDLQNYESYPGILNEYDLIISAVPGFMGFNTLKAILNAKKDVVDISFFPEDCRELSDEAKHNNAT